MEKEIPNRVKNVITLSFKEYDSSRKYSVDFFYYGFNKFLDKMLLKPCLTLSDLKELELSKEPGISLHKNNIYSIDCVNPNINCLYIDRAIDMIGNIQAAKVIKGKTSSVISKICSSIAKSDGIIIPNYFIKNSIEKIEDCKIKQWKIVLESQSEQLPF